MLSIPLSARRFSHGFSLVELLTVIAIMAVLLSLGAGSVAGIGRANQLTATGNRISNLASLARQEAISQNTPTALIMLPADADASIAAAFAVLLLQDGQWKQISRWEILPESVVIDADTSSFLQNGALPALADAASPIGSFRGKSLSVSDCSARVFLPSGGLWNPDKSATVRLIEKNRADPGANYYDITFLGATGLPKIERR